MGFGISISYGLGFTPSTGSAPQVPLGAATNVVALFDEPNPADMLRSPTTVLGVFEEPNPVDMLRSAANLVNTITY